jgi:putative ABC transport system substrate-binding protein
MKRRIFVGGLGGLIAAAPTTGQGQSPKRNDPTLDRVRRIAVLIDGSAPHPLVEALRRGLLKQGYVEGRNATFETRYADGRMDRAIVHAVDLVRFKPDVIVAHFTPAVRAAKEATTTIPIVMAPAGAPVEAGLVASLARPGGNVTGVTNMAAELGGRRLQLLKDIIPNLARVAVLASTHDPFTKPFLHYMHEAAPGAGIQLAPVMVGGPAEFAEAFAAMARDGARAVIIQGVFNSNRKLIVELAQRHRLAVMSFDRDTAAIGGLASLSANTSEIYERAAGLVARILDGANPADLPVEQPTTFELVINLKTARALNLAVPQSVLLSADEVIE